jgi:hypothetical protein
VIWQDAALTATSVAFTVGVVPMVWKRLPPPVFTCLVTAAGLTTLVVCYATLGSLGLTAAAESLGAGLWWVLAAMAVAKR